MSEPTSYTEFLSSALKNSEESLATAHLIAREGLGCMNSRDFAISLQLAKNVDKILKEAQARIEAEVKKVEEVSATGWYQAI
jgi:hypothetical protein